MGMPVSVEIADETATQTDIDAIYAYFQYVDETFSTYKEHSEIMRINRGELTLEQASADMQTIFALAEETRQETYGYFDIRHKGMIDPSGIVKGWSIYHAGEKLWNMGYRNFFVDAGGDAEIVGHNDQDQNWLVGIRNPFNMQEIVKVLSVTNCGVATSGTYIRGQHIYDPKDGKESIDDVVSLTVVGSNIYEADRFATAAFAMGKEGIAFIEELEGFEGYMIDRSGMATLTSGFKRYVANA